MSEKKKMTLSIPASLRQRMGPLDRDVNWSEVAAKAFEDELALRQAQRSPRTIEEIVQRMQALERLQSKGHEAIKELGRRWARDRASLERLEALAHDEAFEESWEATHDQWSMGHEFAKRYLCDEHDAERDQAVVDAWVDFLHGQELPDTAERSPADLADDPQFVHLVIEGALDVWEQVEAYLEVKATVEQFSTILETFKQMAEKRMATDTTRPPPDDDIPF